MQSDRFPLGNSPEKLMDGNGGDETVRSLLFYNRSEKGLERQPAPHSRGASRSRRSSDVFPGLMRRSENLGWSADLSARSNSWAPCINVLLAVRDPRRHLGKWKFSQGAQCEMLCLPFCAELKVVCEQCLQFSN